MSKLLKIGVPILVAVLMLVIGTGLVLAKENDTSVLTGSRAPYDDYSGCSQCPGVQYANCPCAGNGGGGGDCSNSGSCQGSGASCMNSGSCQGSGASCSNSGSCHGSGASYGFGNNGTNYQMPCHR